MATRLYLTSVLSDYLTGHNDNDLLGSGSLWNTRVARTTAGSTQTSHATDTVAGPTAGLVVRNGTIARVWHTAPLDADITISGSITWNLWASESNMNANVAINGLLEVIDGATGAITLIDRTARTTEVNVSSFAVNNFAETPAAGVACKRGDRLRITIFGDDSTANMASGFSFAFSYNGPTGGANGDSWVELTENLSFAAAPAGTTVYLTDVASAVSTASVDREAWTSRDDGSVNDVVNTAAGWTSGIQVTDTAGGTVVDWFTRPLQAFTLGGAATVLIEARQSNAAAQASLGVEIARVDGDGTNPTVWAWTKDGTGVTGVALATTPTEYSFLVSGDDLAISDGQRLRIRVYIDDSNYLGPLVTGHTVTLSYGATGSPGDSFVQFSQTLTEYIVSNPPRQPPYLQLLPR